MFWRRLAKHRELVSFLTLLKTLESAAIPTLARALVVLFDTKKEGSPIL
jgi:hypothetical protein